MSRASTTIKVCWVSSGCCQATILISQRAAGHYAEARWSFFFVLLACFGFWREMKQPTRRLGAVGAIFVGGQIFVLLAGVLLHFLRAS